MSDVKTGIPTVELKLPISGSVVVLYSYITMGQQRELQRILMPTGSFDMVDGAVKMKDFNVDNFDKWQSKAIEFLIKEINEAGSVGPFSQEWFDGLPAIDGQTIYGKIGEIVGESNLSESAKKK